MLKYYVYLLHKLSFYRKSEIYSLILISYCKLFITFAYNFEKVEFIYKKQYGIYKDNCCGGSITY